MELRLEALHKKNLVKTKKIIVDSITDQLVPQVYFLKTPKMFDSFTKIFEGKNINQNMALRKQVEESEDPECRDHTVILCKGLSNQRTTCSDKKRSEECSSGDVHLEWPPRIM